MRKILSNYIYKLFEREIMKEIYSFINSRLSDTKSLHRVSRGITLKIQRSAAQRRQITCLHVYQSGYQTSQYSVGSIYKSNVLHFCVCNINIQTDN